MGHKADHRFFSSKRPWSHRKDLVLRHYLVPYLPKIATQQRPILIVDGFAGPGRFDDGEPGSPAIIADVVMEEMRRRPKNAVYCLFIEADPVLHERLRDFARDRGFVATRNARFTECIDEVVQRASTHQVFLYLDPFTVEGLEWPALSRIFRYLHQGTSVEILLNFNVDSFARRGLAVLKRTPPSLSSDLPEPAWEREQPSSVNKLNEIVGGDWWIPILDSAKPYPQQIAMLLDTFVEQLRGEFAEVCIHEIKERWQHMVPKYVLVFASRHPDALLLMNDAMGKSREQAAEDSRPPDALFESRPEHVVPDSATLTTSLLRTAEVPVTRYEAVLQVVRTHFGLYSIADIRGEVRRLLEQGELESETGQIRIADDVQIWRKRK